MASKASKIIFWTAVAAIAAGGAYIAYKQFSKGSGSGETTKDDTKTGGGTKGSGSGTSANTTSPTSSLPDGEFPLNFGDKNKKVLALQSILNKRYGTNLVVDGAFGQKTADALCKHYFTSCFGSTQARLYGVSASDFIKIKG